MQAATATDPEGIALELVAFANAAGGHDNITAALARVGPLPCPRLAAGSRCAAVRRRLRRSPRRPPPPADRPRGRRTTATAAGAECRYADRTPDRQTEAAGEGAPTDG